jgi:nicotinamidase/pyrazinamidase
MTPDPSRSVLLVVDVQVDFLPGGALAVADGDAVLEPIAALMKSDAFRDVVATQDWHPAGHASFASTHPGRKPFEPITLYGHEQVLWPDHCVVGSAGAALHPALPWERLRAVIRKGSDPEVDSYSGFRNNWDVHGERPSTGLGGYLHECGFTDVYVCGLARDYCAKWTAEDAVDLGFATTFFWDLTRPVDPASDHAVRDSLIARGVNIVDARAPSTQRAST